MSAEPWTPEEQALWDNPLVVKISKQVASHYAGALEEECARLSQELKAAREELENVDREELMKLVNPGWHKTPIDMRPIDVLLADGRYRIVRTAIAAALTEPEETK